MAEDTAPHGTLDPPRHPQENGTDHEHEPPQPEGEQGRPPAAREYSHGSSSDEPEEPRQTVAGRLVSAAIVLVSLLLLVLVIAATSRNPRTDDAEVFANFIGLAPLVNGPITELRVRDNQQVHAGEVLFRMDDRPYRYALARAVSDQAALEGQITDEARRIRAQQSAAVAAEAGARSAAANVDRAAANIRESEADVANAKAALATSQAEYTYSLNNLHRVEPLLARQFVTADQVDQLRTGTAAKELGVRQAEAQVRLAEARLLSNQAALTAASASVSQSQAQHSQAQHAVTTLEPYTGQRGGRLANIENAQYNYNNCTVQAPFDGRVTDLTISTGEYAHAGQQVFTLIDTRVWWVVANFRETQLHRILPGMHVDVYLMSDPHRLYRGVVDSTAFGVTPDASTVGRLAQGLPDVQRTLSWVHLASRYPVRIRVLDPEPNGFRIAESAVVVVRGWKGW